MHKHHPLDAEKIRQYCQQKCVMEHVNIEVFDEIDSTNQYLKEKPHRGGTDICCANRQTKGRGRQGREWFSPADENIYCSMRWPITCPINQLPALSIVTGLAIIAAMQTLSIERPLQIKWPNDMYCDNKKWGGILIESTMVGAHQHLVIIGVGLNINAQSNTLVTDYPIDKPWCSLRDLTQKQWDRNQIIGALFIQIEDHIRQFIKNGLEPFLPDWKKSDWLLGSKVQVLRSSTHALEGVASGINTSGFLGVTDRQGKIHWISSGEVIRVITT